MKNVFHSAVVDYSKAHFASAHFNDSEVVF